jgi:hypothetical protein
MDWNASLSREASLTFLREVSASLANDGGPLASRLDKLVQEGDFAALLDFQFEYRDESDVNDLWRARQIQALFSKQEKDWFGLGIDTEKVAYDKFLKAEQRCKATNDRLDMERPFGLVSQVSHLAARKIFHTLGEVPKLSELTFAFGPGATTNVKSAVASHKAKLSASPVCSEDMLPFVGEFLAEFPYLTEHHLVRDTHYAPLFSANAEEYGAYVSVQVGEGKLTFVPKSAKTKRPIVVEPILNGLAQKGIGEYIKDRMKRSCELDLKDQTRNRAGAFTGSVNGFLATIDLANASDTVSIGVVAELLPPEWFEFLARYRTGKVNYRGQTICLEKFSSMGNAYTFELESLIFYSLAWACCVATGHEASLVSVFGDDLIVPVATYPLLVEVLEFYGFEVNAEKSYAFGPFRESCGADWLRGFDIRPFYVKERISERILYLMHNFFMRRGERKLARLVENYTAEPYRLYGPDGYGDGHLLGSYSLRSNRNLRRSGFCGGFFDTYTLKPKRFKKRRLGDWLYPAYSIYTRGQGPVRASPALNKIQTPGDPDTVRGSCGYAKVSIYTLATTIFGGFH